MVTELPGAPPRSVTLSTASAIVCTPNPRRRKVVLSNDDATIVIYVCRGATAIVNAGIPIPPRASLVDEPDVLGRMYYGPWSAVATSGTPVLAISEE